MKYLQIFPFRLYCFYLRYLFHHVPEKNVCWGTFYDVTVLGTDIFKQCRRSQAEIARRFAQTYEETRFKFRTNAWLLNTLLPTSIANHFFRLMAKLLLKFRYEEFNPNLVNARRLTVNPNLFFELRAKIVLLTEMFNYIAIIILVFFDITMILSFVIYMPTIWGPYPTFPYVPLILLDVTLIIHGMNQLARSAMILSFTAIISGTVNISHVARYRRMTEELMQKHIRLQKKLKKRQTIEDTRSIGILMEILTEHTRICSQILQYNRELYGHIVFSSLVLNIPINVAIVSRVVFQVDLPEVEKSLTVLFIMIQFSLLAVALIPLARYSKIVSHSRNLPMLIDMIGGKWIRVKIKFMAYYERINNRKKYGVSVGPSETLTNRMLFEVPKQSTFFVY